MSSPKTPSAPEGGDPSLKDNLPWWRQLDGYHWFVFIIASAAWFFDCLDQRLFSLARIPALTSLLPGSSPGDVQASGKVVTALFLVGWGVGGLLFGSLGDRFGRARMLTLTVLIGSLLASTGVVGLWAIGEFAVDVQRNVFGTHFSNQGAAAEKIPGLVNRAISLSFMLQMAGAAIGMAIFTQIAIRYGRKTAFGIGFSAALLSTAFVYWKMNSPADAYWMMPLMGACQLGVFAGFAIYLPELFPSSMRSTGTSFCYNLGRFAAAAGSLFSASLATGAYGHLGSPGMERYSAITMCAIFLIGLAVLPFAPETRGKPLPSEA